MTSRKCPDIGGSNLASSGCPTSLPSAPLQVQSRSLAEHFLTSFSFSLPQFNHFLETTQGREALAASENHRTLFLWKHNTNHLSELGEREWAGHTHDLMTRVNNPDARIGNLHREGHPARTKRTVTFSSPSLTDTCRP